MNQAVRLPDHALASIDDQLPANRAELFRILDLREAIAALSATDWWSLPEISQAPGIRRFTVEAGRTCAGYHLFVGLDAWSVDAGAMVIYHVDIWPDGWPSPS